MQILSNIPLTYTFSLFSERKDVLVFVTTRLGGFSQKHLASCNIGFNIEESAEITAANRRNICDALGIDFEKLTFQQQVHEDYISFVDLKNAGSGLLRKEDALPHSDAMITTEKNVTIFAQAADCVPIAIYDTKQKIAAVVHAGWRGTVKKVAQKTAIKMIKEFNCSPNTMLVGIGPSIGSCCYEVGKDVIESVNQSFADTSKIILQQGNSVHLDLWEANKCQLLEIEIPESNIEIAQECTKCNAHIYFSSRNDHGHTGRFGIGITIL